MRSPFSNHHNGFNFGLLNIGFVDQAIKGYQGVGTITDSVYYVPLMDADGNVQVIRAYGVEEIAVVTRTRLPPRAWEIFPIIRLAAPWMETRAGHVENQDECFVLWFVYVRSFNQKKVGRLVDERKHVAVLSNVIYIFHHGDQGFVIQGSWRQPVRVSRVNESF